MHLDRTHDLGAMTDAAKRCRCCGEEKAASEFYRASGNADGLQNDCKECRCVSVRAYRVQNLEAVRQRDRDRAARDAETKRERAAEWYYENRPRALESRRRYYEENRSKVIAHSMAARARKQGAPAIEVFTREEIIERDGGICHVCGVTVPTEEIELDHVIPLEAGGPHTRENVKVSHKECNAERRLLPTHCPHGHAYDEANTYVRPSDGARACRACARERARRTRQPAAEVP